MPMKAMSLCQNVPVVIQSLRFALYAQSIGFLIRACRRHVYWILIWAFYLRDLSNVPRMYEKKIWGAT